MCNNLAETMQVKVQKSTKCWLLTNGSKLHITSDSFASQCGVDSYQLTTNHLLLLLMGWAITMVNLYYRNAFGTLLLKSPKQLEH